MRKDFFFKKSVIQKTIPKVVSMGVHSKATKKLEEKNSVKNQFHKKLSQG